MSKVYGCNSFGVKLFSYVGNIFHLKSIELAPNPGYPTAILGLQIVIISLISLFLFGSKITLTKGIGIGFAAIAIILLAL